MDVSFSVDAVIAGTIYFETIINRNKQISLNTPGGSALYCAAGFRLWDKHPGILGKMSEDKSERWIHLFQSEGIDTSGIRKLRGAFDQDRFYAVLEDGRLTSESPQKYFFALNQPLPKYLLGHEAPRVSQEINRAIQPESLSQDDISDEYLQVGHLVIAPCDLYTHLMLPPFYRFRTNGRIILCGSSTFMQPAFWYEFPPLLRGVEVFITTENQLRRLFLGKNENIWEMIEFVTSTGVEMVLVYSNEEDHYLMDKSANAKYRIPNYPTNIVDPIGAFPAFCGGFSSPYITHFDPIESALAASVTASIKKEGSGPLFLLQTLPELARARAESLRDQVQIVQ